MPQEFQSYNPTQVGQGNNLVYTPVNQQYGQLYAQGLGRVANQRAKEAKAAQEKEYAFKAPAIGGSLLAPEAISGAIGELNQKATKINNFSSNRDAQNKIFGDFNNLKTDATQLALGEEDFKNIDKAIVTSTDPSIAPVSSLINNENKKYNARKHILETYGKHPDKESAWQTATKAGAVYLTDPRNKPRIERQMTLDKALEGVDPYSKKSYDGSSLSKSNNEDFLVQRGQEKKYINKNNLLNLIDSSQKNTALRNWYRENEFAGAGDIYSKKDADNYVVEKYYNDPKNPLDINKYQNDEQYRDKVVQDAYKKQENVINDKIKFGILYKYGVDEQGLNEIEDKANFIARPGAGSGANKKALSVVENENVGVFTTADGLNHDSRSYVTATFNNPPVLKFNPESITDGSVYSNDSKLLEGGSSDIQVTNLSKLPVVKVGTEKGKIAPLMIYTKDGKPFDGTFDDIKNNLGNYKIVSPKYLLDTFSAGMKQGKGLDQMPDIDKVNNLVDATELVNNKQYNPQFGYSVHFAKADKASDVGDVNSGLVTSQTDKTGAVLLLTAEDAKTNPLLRQVLTQKDDKGKVVGFFGSDGNITLNGLDKFNNTKYKNLGRVKGQGSNVNLGVGSKYAKKK
jgi:hypothetical protein